MHTQDAYYASLKKPVITLDMPWPEYMVAIVSQPLQAFVNVS